MPESAKPGRRGEAESAAEHALLSENAALRAEVERLRTRYEAR
jgi:hypothetical protein